MVGGVSKSRLRLVSVRRPIEGAEDVGLEPDPGRRVPFLANPPGRELRLHLCRSALCLERVARSTCVRVGADPLASGRRLRDGAFRGARFLVASAFCAAPRVWLGQLQYLYPGRIAIYSRGEKSRMNDSENRLRSGRFSQAAGRMRWLFSVSWRNIFFICKANSRW